MCDKGMFEVRNVGFVRSQWQYKGILTNKKDSRISGEGRTYDCKLYTFKEANYSTMWDSLELLAKPLDHRETTHVEHKESQGEEEEEKSQEEENAQPPEKVEEQEIKRTATADLKTHLCMSGNKVLCNIF